MVLDVYELVLALLVVLLLLQVLYLLLLYLVGYDLDLEDGWLGLEAPSRTRRALVDMCR